MARLVLHAKRPCRECPWRRDTPPGQFPACRYGALRNTSGRRGAEAGVDQPWFACHMSPEGGEYACAGWLASVGLEHLGVRVALAAGRLPATAVSPGADWPPLFDSYEEMAATQAMAPPVWLLDVNGVIDASGPGWGGPGRAQHVIVEGLPYRLRWEPKAVACIRTLHMAGVVEVHWCTNWCPWADVLETLWHLPTFSRAWPAGPVDPVDAWPAKVQAALAVLDAGRRLVWTDDDLDPANVPAQVTATSAALLIRTKPSRGLRPEHVHQIEQFARDGYAPDGAGCRNAEGDLQ